MQAVVPPSWNTVYRRDAPSVKSDIGAASLLAGFYEFFVEQFDYNTMAVDIRNGGIVPRDPFVKLKAVNKAAAAAEAAKEAALGGGEDEPVLDDGADAPALTDIEGGQIDANERWRYVETSHRPSSRLNPHIRYEHLCVPDPFILTRNTCMAIGPKAFEMIMMVSASHQPLSRL